MVFVHKFDSKIKPKITTPSSSQQKYFCFDVIIYFLSVSEKSSQFLRVESHLCRGEIVQLDSMIVFRSKAGSGLLRLPYSSKQEDYVSNGKVDHANLVKGTSKLLYEDQRHCLKPATFTNYDPKAEVFNLGTNLRKKAHQVYYADSSPGTKTDSNVCSAAHFNWRIESTWRCYGFSRVFIKVMVFLRPTSRDSVHKTKKSQLGPLFT